MNIFFALKGSKLFILTGGLVHRVIDRLYSGKVFTDGGAKTFTALHNFQRVAIDLLSGID